MVNKQQEAKDGLVWLEKYIEQLEAERDHMDAQLSAYENDLVLLDVTDKLKIAEARVQELEEHQRNDLRLSVMALEEFERQRERIAKLEEKLLDAEQKSCWIPQPPKDGE